MSGPATHEPAPEGRRTDEPARGGSDGCGVDPDLVDAPKDLGRRSVKKVRNRMNTPPDRLYSSETPPGERKADAMDHAVDLDLDERALILRCQSGERDAFEPIVNRYMRRAAAFALGWTGSRDDALDLSQEAFARAFRAIARFDPERPFYPWFHRILKNLCLNHLGRASVRREVPLADGFAIIAANPSPERLAERAELREIVWSAIRRLSERDREILVLREFQDLTYAEIAAVLDIPRGTVMSRLHHARARLRALLAPILRPSDSPGGRHE